MKSFKYFVLFLVFLGLTFTVSAANRSKLIGNSAADTVVTFTVDSYDFEQVQTPRGEELVIKAPHAGRIMTTGAPDLVKFSTAMVIPDQGQMGIDIIDAQYTELENIKIAPSKGNLLRTQDPNLIPYEYGKEYKKDAFFPGTLAELNKPYIARDFRGQAAIFYPFQYNPVTKTLRVYNTLTVNVYKKGNAGENEFIRNKPLKMDEIVHEFKNVYSRHFINYDAIAQSEASLQYTPLNDPMGRMLIVCYSGFMSNMAPFVSYKQSIGYTVDLVDYSTIGSAAALKTYVANYYNTNGLTYLLIVGDNAQVPVSSTSAGDSDNNYGYIVGSDHYQEIFVGRFSATSTAHVDTQVNRTIYYERDLASSATWFRKATGMGTSEGPGHNGEYDYQHINLIMADLAGYGYTTYTNHQSGGTTANLSNLINSGQGTLWYCGHGNYDGWYCGTGGWTFLNAQVVALTNDNMLPAIFSVACQVGNFKNYTCFCEYWLRETNGSNPTGAIAHAGSTINQSWNPPMDAQDETCDILVSTSGPKRTFGGVFVNGLFKMNDLNTGTAGTNMTDTWVCFGDSSVQLRTPGTPDGPGGGGPTSPIANFTGSPTTISIGGTVNYTDTSTGSPTSWSWTFEGGTPATSTAQNPTVTYNTLGSYDVTLIASNTVGSDTITKYDYVSVVAAPSYCTSSGTSQASEWIARVVIGNLDNSSGASPYTDFTAKSAALTKGASVSVTLTPGYGGSSRTEYWRVWIDYNKDGDFADSGEQILSLRGKNARSSSFTVSTSALTGNTRMRVSMEYGSYPTYCGTFSYGEVEDYTAIIQ